MSAEPVPVAQVQRMGSYQGVPALGCLLSIEAEKRLKVNDPLYDRATLDAAVAAARAEEQALWQQDAERYRWLREHTAGTGLSRWTRALNTQFLDEAVDATMRNIKPEVK